MIDRTTLLHGLIALFVPLGWVMILYPLYLRGRRDWKKTLLFVVVLSFAAMVAKEILLDPEISPDDIAADLLGLFFGTAVVSVVVYLERKIFSKEKLPPGNPVPKVEQSEPKPEGRPAIKPEGTISLRDTMAAWVRVQERGAAFYEASARGLGDSSLKGAWGYLIRDKRSLVREVLDLLSRWPSRAPDVTFLDWMDDQIERYDLYALPSEQDLSADALLDRALVYERDAYHVFFGLRDYFRSESWKTGQMDQIIRAQERWLARLERLAAVQAEPADARSGPDNNEASGRKP
jgi:hypothetical protein